MATKKPEITHYADNDVIDHESHYADSVSFDCGCEIKRDGKAGTKYYFDNFCATHDPTIFRDGDDSTCYPFENEPEEDEDEDDEE